MRGGIGKVDLPAVALTARAAALYSFKKTGPAAPTIQRRVRERGMTFYSRLEPLVRTPALGEQLTPRPQPQGFSAMIVQTLSRSLCAIAAVWLIPLRLVSWAGSYTVAIVQHRQRRCPMR